MNYDKIVSQYLTEAYFGSPYEKRNNIKRQVGLVEADKETQQRKLEKIMAAAEITAEMMNDIFENVNNDPTVPEPTRDDFISIAFAALGTAGFDDQALQRAFNDPNMQAIGDEFTLADFRKYNEALSIVFKDTPYKFLTPERIRRILKDLEATVAELIKTKEAEDQRQAEMEREPEPTHPRPDGMPHITDYAKELLARKGL